MELWNEGELMYPLRIESLKEHHLSRLRNKLIANVFYRSGQIEAWGRGTLKILDDARKGSYPEPDFEYFENGVLVKFAKKTFEEKQQIPDVSNIKHAGSILQLIQDNPKITIPEMAQALSVTTRTVERVLSLLTEGQIVKRDGANKNGDWMLLYDFHGAIDNGSIVS
jgi:ATP-dependent DNA helicase RecG